MNNATKKRMNKRIAQMSCLLFSLVSLLIPTLPPSTVNAQDRSTRRSGREVYRGNIIYIGGARTATEFFTLTINTWSQENDVQTILTALRNGGQSELRKAIGDEKRGTIQLGNRIGLDLNALWISEDEEGRRIYALAERWVGFGELRRGARSTDYPFTYIELYVDDNGKGEGTLIPAARVRAKRGRTIEVENFGIYPARLTNVRRSGR
jgi:hypothetical protein